MQHTPTPSDTPTAVALEARLRHLGDVIGCPAPPATLRRRVLALAAWQRRQQPHRARADAASVAG